LTLLPALIALCGRAFFWPRKITPQPQAGVLPARRSFWLRVGQGVVRAPVVVVVVCLVVLLPAAISALTARPSFDTVASLPQEAPAVAGFNLYRAHFGNQLGQVSLYLSAPGQNLAGSDQAATIAQITQALQQVQQVSLVRSPSQPNGAGNPASADAARAFFASDGSVVRFDVTISVDPTSAEAVQTVDHLESAARTALKTTGLHNAEVLEDGQAASTRDMIAQLGSDFTLVGLLVSLAIFVVLALLLRSLTAPLYLLASIALSTATAIGLTALIYHQAVDLPIFWTMPLFGFVFLVALGEDFNILMMSRVREETEQTGIKDGIARAIGSTGGVVSSCGLVVAATFFLLVRNPVLIAQQIGVVVIIGVLLDTFIVRPMLVPAIARLLGRWNWVWFNGVGQRSKVAAEAAPPRVSGA
jgi:RND superfamily putative drug exporter